MAPLINLNDPTEQAYFAPPDKQKLLSSALGNHWREILLGGDDKLDQADFKQFCDTYQPTETCPDILKKIKGLSTQARKTQILDWMFSELKRPSLEAHRQLWEIRAQNNTNGSKFAWRAFEIEATKWMDGHGFGTTSRNYEKIGSLLRAYVNQSNPPSPEVLADIFATGLQLVILEESFGSLKDFKGKDQIQKAIRTLLERIRAGKLDMQILPALPRGVGALYFYPKDFLGLPQTSAGNIFSFERSNARLHELFHHIQDLDCQTLSVLATEYAAYHFGALSSYLLFPNHVIPQQTPITNDFMDLAQNEYHKILTRNLESLAKRTLSDAGLKIGLTSSLSQVDLNKIEAEAKLAVDIIYSMRHFDVVREGLTFRSYNSKIISLSKIPTLQEMSEKLKAKPGIWEYSGMPQAINSYFNLYYERLAIEYELQTSQTDRNNFAKDIILPSFKNLALTDRVLNRYDGVEKSCPIPMIQLITDGPEELNPKISKLETEKATKKPIPSETKLTPPPHTPANTNAQFSLSLPLRIYAGSHASGHNLGEVNGCLISLGTSVGFLLRNASDHFMGGAGLLGDFTIWGEGHLKRSDDSEIFTKIYRHDIGLYGAVGYYSGTVELFIQPALGYRRVDAADEGLNQLWLGTDLMFQYPRAGLSLGARARFSPMDSHDFGAFFQFDLPSLLQFQDDG